jgi:hypothetical protein
MKRFYMAEGKETPDGEYMLVVDHEKVLSESVPAAYEKRLQQFDVLRRYVYRTLAQTHQVLWEVDRIPELGEVLEKEKAKNDPIPAPDINEEYDALVRDAMHWRSRPTGPKPFDLPLGVELRDKTLQDAANAVRIALRDYYPHGENAAAAVLALCNV